MSTTYEPKKIIGAEGSASKERGRQALNISLLLIIVAAALTAIYMQSPPAAVPASAPATGFSSARAMKHLQVIAQRPHPIGSDESDAVRNYIFNELKAQSLDPQIQTTTVVDPNRSSPYRIGTVQNVVGKRKGTADGRAVLLVAHYDSVPTGPGAGDNGAGVATLLETSRALKSLPPLRNDIIFLFTDGEEVGLLGARAFIAEHPWAKDVSLVLNFDARGSTGPVIMFETSDENGWLIQEFAEASPHPIANSLAYEIYKWMPNDTDLTVFKLTGKTRLSTLNFAFISGYQSYHTATDDLNNFSERSLQHQGSYALSLTRHFGNLSFLEQKQRNAVYFNPIGSTFIHYSGGFILPLTILVVLLFITVLGLGFKHRLLTLKGIAFGFSALLISGIAASVFVSLVWMLIRSLHKGYEFVPRGEPYNREYYLTAVVLLTIGVVGMLYYLFRRMTSVDNLTVGGLLWWTLLTVTVSHLIPGGSYLLTWPLLVALIGTALLFSPWREGRLKRFIILTVYAIPAVVLISPMIYQVSTALTLNGSGAVAGMLALLMGLLIPQLDLFLETRKYILPVAAMGSSTIFIAAGLMTAGFSASHPRVDNIFYVLNADTGQALWASADKQPSEWTSQFFRTSFERGLITDFFPLARRTFLKSPAPLVSIPAPQVTLLEEGRNNELRTLRLHISSLRKAPVVSIYTVAHSGLVMASVNGKEVSTMTGDEKHWGVHYYGFPDSGAEVILKVKSSQPIELRIDDRTYSLPEGIHYTMRPSHIIPSPSQYCDSTLVSKSFRF